MAFSISVILATIGIMDGFDKTLKSGLRRSVGDMFFYSSNGFFKIDDDLKKILKDKDVVDFSPLVQTEGFVLFESQSKGVLIKGVNPETFSKVTDLKISIEDQGVVVGKELARQLDLKIGDEIVLAFANGNKRFKGLPGLKRLKVSKVIEHGIYQKDLRIVYVKLSLLQKALNLKERVNVVTLKIPEKRLKVFGIEDQQEGMMFFKEELEDTLGDSFYSRVYWQEYSSLIEAVKIEKVMIGLILQLVVIISVFNVLAFVIFLNEKRSKEIFLIKALGLSQNRVVKIWSSLIIIGWILSCGLSMVLVELFNWALMNLSILKLPGDIYHLGRLQISLETNDYLFVFLLALLWLLAISGILLWRLKKRPILEGLRREFA